MAAPMKAFQLLEINLISAQDLQPVSKKMRTYATAWMNPARKLSSCVDTDGKSHPTWNDKFVFRVDDEFLRRDTSSVMIEIYAVHWLKDVLVGTVRVLVGNLIPPPAQSQGVQHYAGMRFVALQVRRPSGRPQGILNIGVALLGSSMKSMPLYRQLSMSAVGFRDLIGDSLQQPDKTSSAVKPIVRRSKSERSDLDRLSPTSSILPKTADPNESSILSITHNFNPFAKVGKASSAISVPKIAKKGKSAGSVLSDSILSKESSGFRRMADKAVDEKSLTKVDDTKNPLPVPVPVPVPVPNHMKANSVWSDSEVGPSPSEVAAAMMVAERKYPLDDNQSSMLDGWSVDESVEGLRSKLERWRMELPPLYDRAATSGGYSTSSYKSSGRHARRHSDGSSRVFSCFGNVFGYECQCICGKPPGKRSRSARFHSPSTRSFM